MAEHNLEAIAFPRLDEGQIATLARCAETNRKRYRDGEILIRSCERDFKFFVIQSGAVVIVDESGDTPKTVRVHLPGEFTGDVSHLTGRPAVISAVARGDCEVYEITTEALRQTLNRCPDLADIILQAFIARRQLLRSRELSRVSHDRLALFARHLPDPRVSVQESRPCSPGWIWRPIRR